MCVQGAANLNALRYPTHTNLHAHGEPHVVYFLCSKSERHRCPCILICRLPKFKNTPKEAYVMQVCGCMEA